MRSKTKGQNPMIPPEKISSRNPPNSEPAILTEEEKRSNILKQSTVRITRLGIKPAGKK